MHFCITINRKTIGLHKQALRPQNHRMHRVVVFLPVYHNFNTYFALFYKVCFAIFHFLLPLLNKLSQEIQSLQNHPVFSRKNPELIDTKIM